MGPHVLRRDLEHVQLSEIADVLLIMPMLGSCIVGYGGGQVHLSPTDMCLVNGWEAYFLQFDLSAEMATFRMPSSALEARSKSSIKKSTFRRIKAQRGMTKIAASMLTEALEQLDHIDSGQERILFNNLASAICASLYKAPDQEIERSTYHEQFIRRIRRYIESNIEDENLNANQIASAHSVSVRYLNKLFETETDTAIQYIRSLRLRLFAQRLIADTSRSLTIKETVFGCGFSDYAHFHRAFKQYFQCTPNEYRNRNSRKKGD